MSRYMVYSQLYSFACRLFAIGSQLSPEQGSSGIEMLETDTFKLHCFQTLTGMCLQRSQGQMDQGIGQKTFGKQQGWCQVFQAHVYKHTHLFGESKATL